MLTITSHGFLFSQLVRCFSKGTLGCRCFVMAARVAMALCEIYRRHRQRHERMCSLLVTSQCVRRIVRCARGGQTKKVCSRVRMFQESAMFVGNLVPHMLDVDVLSWRGRTCWWILLRSALFDEEAVSGFPGCPYDRAHCWVAGNEASPTSVQSRITI